MLLVNFAADDGLAAFGGEVWFMRRFAVAEAPGQERIVDELCEISTCFRWHFARNMNLQPQAPP
jgi:hypothetical protein